MPYAQCCLLFLGERRDGNAVTPPDPRFQSDPQSQVVHPLMTFPEALLD